MNSEVVVFTEKLDGKEVRLADYFEVIAWTSMGGLVTAMLTVPNEEDRPLYAYNGKYLHNLLRDKLKHCRLSKTLTNVVNPSFDMGVTKDFELCDVCISTSAAPIYLPPHHFKMEDTKGNSRAYDLIDGGVTANNPLLAILRNCPCLKSIKSKEDYSRSYRFGVHYLRIQDYGRFLVISLGTGRSHGPDNTYTYKNASKWGIFEALKDLGDNYLRIQDETLTGIESYVDIATKANLDRLVKIGENLLKKQVSRVNLDTGLSEPIENGGTNADKTKAVDITGLITTQYATDRYLGTYIYPQKITLVNSWKHPPAVVGLILGK
ncbi:hypothetical protein M9H77_36257 [Catharanthus roseus]|uniref:Uncharacterized protein n=1 Tax=Catharanthus roseus TaxID=4058 RepID=A0ACB9ZVJ2_CATRO|nr:hypothetical protein M9H77_36257 [Catharanthus roseus]